jgi:OmpA-OmpF porin, OOP family
MPNNNQMLNLWILGFAIVSTSGCASRGYVRNQVETRAAMLSTAIDENRVDLETTQQGLSNLGVRAEEAHRSQQEAMRETERSIQAVRSETGLANQLAAEAQRATDEVESRVTDLAALFADRSRFQVRVSHDILFGFDSAAIGEQHHQELEAISALLASDPDALLLLEGRTDSLGDSEYNRRLGERRVEAATQYLVMELGVPTYRIHGFSYGEARPAHDNADMTNRFRNRAVTAVVLGPPIEATFTASSQD